jgi:hypothetical protein
MFAAAVIFAIQIGFKSAGVAECPLMSGFGYRNRRRPRNGAHLDQLRRCSYLQQGPVFEGGQIA